MYREVNDAFFDLLNEQGHLWQVNVAAHLLDDLLDNVVAVEVKTAILNVLLLDELVKHFDLLLVREDLEASLHYSASMLMCAKVIDLSADSLIHHVLVLVL